MTKFKDSALAHKYLDGLRGIEIGASAHNPFNIKNCLNVNYTDEDTAHTEEQKSLCGEVVKVDIIAPGDDLPFKDKTVDFVLSSHCLEHFFDPIGALLEWKRVTKDDGIIFMVVPHKERTFDKERERTTIEELRERFLDRRSPQRKVDAHHSVWITEDLVELCKYLNFKVVAVQDVDDKVGNGFTIVVRV